MNDTETRTERAVADFTHGYAYALLWACTSDDAPEGGDAGPAEVYPELWQTPAQGWELDAFTPDARETVGDDAGRFFTENQRDLLAANRAGHAWRDLGGDLALTRNRHGAGYWDRGLGEVGDRLTDAAHTYGEAWCSVNMSDDAALVSLAV